MTACTPGLALGPTLGNEYGRTLLFYVVKIPGIKNKAKSSLDWLHVYVLLDRKCFVIQYWDKMLDEDANSPEEILAFQWFDRTLRNFATRFTKKVATLAIATHVLQTWWQRILNTCQGQQWMRQCCQAALTLDCLVELQHCQMNHVHHCCWSSSSDCHQDPVAAAAGGDLHHHSCECQLADCSPSSSGLTVTRQWHHTQLTTYCLQHVQKCNWKSQLKIVDV